MALDNFIPRNAMAECNRCRKYLKGTFTCEVYQEWIPRQKQHVRDCPYYEPMEKEKKG